jgi:aspartate 1-decarboxylase
LRRCTSNGDLIIIAAFAQVHEEQMAGHTPKLVFVDDNNRQTELRNKVATQMV